MIVLVVVEPESTLGAINIDVLVLLLGEIVTLAGFPMAMATLFVPTLMLLLMF